MARRNQNLKFTSKLKGNKPSPPTLEYRGVRKENTSEIVPCKTNSFQKFKRSAYSDDNFEHIQPYHQNLERLEKADKIFKINTNSKTQEIGVKLKEELSKYRNELKEYTNSTKDLEEKYKRINSELNEMKQKHNRLINKRNLPCGDFDTFSDSSSTGTVYSLQRKCNQIFNRSNSFIKAQPLKDLNYSQHNQSEQNIPITDYHKAESEDRKVLSPSQDKENVSPFHPSNDYDNHLQNVYLALKNVIDDQRKSQESADVSSLNKTINKLQNDSERFCSIIEQQSNTLSGYRSRFVKTQQLVKEQQREIEKLNCSNQQLEADTSVIIDQLRHKIETKLRDANILSDIMRDEQLKRERVVKENCLLNERIQAIQAEANQLKIKLDDMNRRKMITISRLKVAERDLKIFKNYNTSLKQEKQKLNEEMKTMSKYLENIQSTSKRTMNRYREQSEKQRRELQKRIFDLEMKLNRSQTSTTSLIQERDRLIAELQSQLNNLVHNFEVSQKHIRVLRKHIYTMCGNSSRQSFIRNRGFGENA